MSIMQFVFVSTITITTFAISLLTAKIYAIGLHASAQTTRMLITVGVLGPLFFVATMFLGRTGKESLIDWVSYPVNALGGIIFYLFITGIVLGIVLLLGRVSHVSIPVFVGYAFLFVGFAMGIAGLIQAKQIKVVQYDFILNGAPKEWEGKKAILVSDTHFGLVNHAKFSKKVVNAIIRANPDFVLHAGDFYDGPANDTVPITESWKELAKVVPVFYAPGNHEEYGDYDGFLTSVKDAGVTALVDSFVEYKGVQIAGITYRDKNQSTIADKVIKDLKVDQVKPLILINHPPTFQNSAIDVGTDLMVSGHTHRGQFWPLNYIVKRIYGKYIYGVNVDDTLTTITTSGVGTAGPPMRLFNTPELVMINFKLN